MHKKVIRVNFFSFFFLPYLHDHGSLRSRNFATVTTRGSDFSCLIPTHKFIPKELIEAGGGKDIFCNTWFEKDGLHNNGDKYDKKRD